MSLAQTLPQTHPQTQTPVPPELQAAYDALKREATTLAGGLSDLSQRAAVYHHLYQASGGNHVFPLIAAHGALWAGGYFRFGMRLGEWLSWQYVTDPHRRRQQLRALAAFADTFRDINRRVCIDTYTNWHFTARFGQHPQAAELIPAELLTVLNRLHAAVRNGVTLSDADKFDVFRIQFLYEQQHVVGPALEQAAAEFNWPLVKFLALQPRIRFAFFPGRQAIWFRNFCDRNERIANGAKVFDMGAAVGWEQVERSLVAYQILPQAFFTNRPRYFAQLRQAVLANC